MSIEITPKTVPAKVATKAYIRRLIIDYDNQSVDVTIVPGNGDGENFVAIEELTYNKQLNPTHFASLVTVLNECRDTNNVSAWDKLLAIVMEA